MKHATVYTYDQPNWHLHDQFKHMENALHICATGNMKRGIQQKYGRHFQNIETFRHVITKFTATAFWYNAEKRMQQYLLFSSLLTKMPFTNNTLKSSFKSNREDMLNTIRILVQAGLTPDDLPVDKQLTTNEQLFKEVWRSFEQVDSSLGAHRQLLAYGNNYQLLFAQQFNLFKSKKIYLHGFYFITPEQQLFFKFLQRNGFELIFYQYYDARFPNTFDFIRLFIDEEFGWSSNWHIETSQQQTSIATKFLRSFEQRKAEKISTDLTITKYNTFFDFLQDVIIPHYPMQKPIESTNHCKIFSANANELNELIQMYYPNLDKQNRNFLAHPIGRFLVNIHSVWHENEIILTEDLLMELFSSGWLIDDTTAEQAINYTYDLQQILPYFAGCKKIEEWEQRIIQLYETKIEVTQMFGSKSKQRLHVQNSSPFTKLSYYNVELERIAQIKDFIEGIRLLAEDLFDSSTGTTKMNFHFSKLLVMLQNRKKKNVYTDELEKNVLDSLMQRLQSITDSLEFLYDDIQPALYLYLSGKFTDNAATKHELITDFLELDGEMFKTHEQPIYFTSLDEKSLPLHEMPLPWPLQKSTLEQIAEQQPTIRLFLHRNATIKETSRYLFFIGLQFLNVEQVHYSWLVNRLNEENLNAAIYIRQLHFNMQPFKPTQLTNEQRDAVQHGLPEAMTTEQQQSFKASIASLPIQMEYTLCPKRFYYSYVLQPFATYDESFMHGFVFSNIYRVAAGSSKKDYDEIAQQLKRYFPHFSQYRLLSSAVDSHRYKYKFDQNNIKSKLEITHLFPGLTGGVRNKLEADTTSITIDEIVQQGQAFSSIPSRECKYCPHTNYCIDVQYGIDDARGDAK